MSGMPDMMPTSLSAAVAPRTGKIIKNGLRVFERGGNLLQNGILHFAFKLSQLSEIVLQSQNLSRRKTDFSERGLARKRLIAIIYLKYFGG